MTTVAKGGESRPPPWGRPWTLYFSADKCLWMINRFVLFVYLNSLVEFLVVLHYFCLASNLCGFAKKNQLMDLAVFAKKRMTKTKATFFINDIFLV